MADRDEKGRFIPGHQGIGGRPAEHFLDIIRECITDDDWRAIANKAKEQAKKGNEKARKWCSDYILGLPLQRSEITGSGTMLVEWIQVNQADNDSSQPVQDTNP